jgi:protein-arginine kinase activator protein McsA
MDGRCSVGCPQPTRCSGPIGWGQPTLQRWQCPEAPTPNGPTRSGCKSLEIKLTEQLFLLNVSHVTSDCAAWQPAVESVRILMFDGTSYVMLCERCQKNEATCHVCTIVDGVSQSRDLCIDCHEASSPEAREFSAAQRDAHCEYCGGQRCAGGTDFLALVTGVQKLKFMCMPCSTEHNRYVQQQLQQDASGLSQREQLVWLRKLDREADEHMKQWVSERGSR